MAANASVMRLLVGATVLSATLATKQETPVDRHQLFIGFLKKTAAEISSRCLVETQSPQEWKHKRPQIQRELRYMLGLEPLPKRTPLHIQITGTLQRPHYRIEKIVFQSMPGLYVTGNFYIPHPRSWNLLPTILYVCGHSPHPLGAKWDYQDRAIWFAEHGYACLILDTLEFGEVPGIHHGIHDLNMWNWLSLGYTPVGVEVWNAMRALDFLETRAEVDKGRIGMTGISGGGAVTWFTSAVDERIAAAVPVCSTYSFGSQADHWVASGQCDCIYFHNTYLTDFPIAGALIAPRPLLICSGQQDIDFPPDGYHEVFRRASRIYDFYGASGLIMEVDENVGHTDSPLLRKETRQWMNRWLKNDNTSLQIESIPETKVETAEELACLSRLPADAINYRIHDQFIQTARKPKPTSTGQWKKRRQQLVRELKDKVFRWFPQKEIPFDTKVTRNRGGWAVTYADTKEVLFDSEAGMPIRVQLLQPRNRSAKTPLLIYVKRPGDSIYFLDFDELLPVMGRCSILIVNPRLTEHPVSAFEYAEIERTASWIGRTVASMQVWDILRAVKWAVEEEQIPSSQIAVYGKGDMGVLAVYAGLFDARIRRVILRDPPTTHWQGAALLNVLRVTDIPEVAGAFAPRRLVFLKEVPTSFNYTRTIYKLLAREGELTAAGSLPEALEIWKF